MSSIDAKWPETPPATSKLHTLITSWFFENQTNEILSHLSEQASRQVS